MNNKKNKNNSTHVSMTNSTVIATVPELPSTSSSSSNMPFYNSNTNYYYPTHTHYVPMNSITTTDLSSHALSPQHSLPPLSQLLPSSSNQQQQLTRQETNTTDSSATILTSDQQPDVMTVKNEQQVNHSYLQQGKPDTMNSSREGHQALHISASSSLPSHNLFESKNRIYVYPPRASVYSSSVPYTASSHMTVRRGYMSTQQQQQRNSYYVLPAQQQQTGILLQSQYGVVSSHHNNNVMMPSLSSSSSSSSSSSAADVNLFHPSNTMQQPGLIYSRNHTNPCYPLPSPPPSLGDITAGDPNQLMITETGITTHVNTNSGRKIYSFVPLPGLNQKKRPRRKFHEVERLYHCNYQNCSKAYGTLNHLNAHVSMQRHGPKRQPSEYKELRKMWRKQKRDYKQQQQQDENYDPSSESSQQKIHPFVTSVNLNQPLLVTSSSSDQHYPLQPTLLSHTNPYQPPPPPQASSTSQVGHWDHLTTTEFM